jgi:hypothetical protein
MNPVSIYLAGAIRDSQERDRAWRGVFINCLGDLPGVTILSPLANKRFNPLTTKWSIGTIQTKARHIVRQDLWMVKRADIVVANFSSLVDGYPSIGTVMEVGAAAGAGKLIYSIIDPSYQGSPNPGAFTLHPFLDEVSTEIFASETDCLEFLHSHLGALTGSVPEYRGDGFDVAMVDEYEVVSNEFDPRCPECGYASNIPRQCPQCGKYMVTPCQPSSSAR